MVNRLSSTNNSSLKYNPVNNSPPKSARLAPSKSDSTEIEKIEEYKFLRSINEFSTVPEDDLKNLANSCRFSNYEPGQYITIEGEEEHSYGYIIVSGFVAMTKTSANGKDLTVVLLQSGDPFGLLLTLAAEKLPAQLSARSLQKSRILRVPINSFMALLRTHQELFKEFVAYLLLSLQASYRLSRGLAHDSVEVRIAAVLSSLAIIYTKLTYANKSPTIYLTRQQLADLTGTTPETAIRVTRAMYHKGWIDIKSPGIIRILDLNSLEELVEV